MPQPHDSQHMRHALSLASRGLGSTWPNPSVGALVLKENVIVGVGVTARGGRPHAETQALAMAGGKAQGATLYVTLEPCAHHGKTPPCTEGIIASGIARVVAACGDPNPKIAGKGFEQLRAAGIEVEQGICEREALALNEGFFSVITRNRPFITLKTATSLDGKITDADGGSKWITGEDSRLAVQVLRASQDAILTGIGTVLADDPQLTCRLPGREADSPQRIVLDSHLRISAQARILPAWIFTGSKTLADEKDKVFVLKKKGASLFAVSLDTVTHLSLTEILAKLAQEGITRLLVEAGGTLAGELVRQNLVDRLYWFRAPLVIGNKGMPALRSQDPLSLSALPRYSLQGMERFGSDVLEIYNCSPI